MLRGCPPVVVEALATAITLECRSQYETRFSPDTAMVMLPTKLSPSTPADFWLICLALVLYKVMDRVLLPRIEADLQARWPQCTTVVSSHKEFGCHVVVVKVEL